MYCQSLSIHHISTKPPPGHSFSPLRLRTLVDLENFDWVFKRNLSGTSFVNRGFLCPKPTTRNLIIYSTQVLFDLIVSWGLSSSSLAGLKTARSSPTLLCCHIELNQTICRCSYEEVSCFWVSDLFALPLNLVKFSRGVTAM